MLSAMSSSNHDISTILREGEILIATVATAVNMDLLESPQKYECISDDGTWMRPLLTYIACKDRETAEMLWI